MDIPQGEIREICLRYKYALDRCEQIMIEAQLHEAPVKEIIRILKENAAKFGITGEIKRRRKSLATEVTREERMAMIQEKRPIAIELSKRGHTVKQISTQTDVPYHMVYNWLVYAKAPINKERDGARGCR